VRVRDVVNATVEELKPSLVARKIEVQNDVPETLPMLKVDKPKFHRLFELLLRDEITALPLGSRVTLTATPLDGVGSKSGIQIQVSDDGPGMPKEALRLVFDPFVVRSDTPMEYGIHLMACYFIVHHHGGKIEARSDNGHGTTFTIRLPLDPNLAPIAEDDTEFLRKVLLNDSLWEKLISSD
jgi:signal transduction histidine kinase